MPLQKIIHFANGGKIALWQLTETTEALLKQVNDTAIWQYIQQRASHPLRHQQMLASQLMAKHLSQNPKENIYHNDKNKPLLRISDAHISLSHSEKYVAAFYHEAKNISIDLEKIAEKALHLHPRFLNPTEYNLLLQNNNLVENACIFWSAKEAVFKYFGGAYVDFKEQFCINSFTQKNNKGYLKMRVDDKYDVFVAFKKNKLFVITYVLLF
ncbi:MAG: 4'-phosphopantetheinyl transferase superfamily protein [Chitinophagales bacterium]|nr:4'-phosphopantetheinyl transferase superfamily protein [Bacteroidota bacterium]MCB9044395.1 4'-phosphopantetheinyl transferase superfamily protein [Chitinophagales bacterium]